jgi:hypothetical protein
VFSNGMNEIEIYRDKNNIVHIEEAWNIKRINIKYYMLYQNGTQIR